MTASTSSTLRPTTAGTLVAGFPRGRFYASPGTRVLSFSRASSTTLPADALRGPGPLGAREGAGDVAAGGRIERSARPLPVAGAGLDQAAQRLVCGAAPRAVLDGHLIARQADRAVDVADGTGPASSRTPYPTAEQAGPQVLRAPVAAALSSPPPDPLPGLAAALRGLTHEAARFPQLIIIYDQIPDRRRGRGFATGIHLNEALEWSKRPGPPHRLVVPRPFLCSRGLVTRNCHFFNAICPPCTRCQYTSRSGPRRPCVFGPATGSALICRTASTVARPMTSITLSMARCPVSSCSTSGITQLPVRQDRAEFARIRAGGESHRSREPARVMSGGSAVPPGDACPGQCSASQRKVQGHGKIPGRCPASACFPSAMLRSRWQSTASVSVESSQGRRP